MKKVILSAVISAFIFLFTSCESKEYDIFSTVYGVVTDASTGEPIPAATVQLSPGGITKVTGTDGYYEFSELSPQQYTVTAHKDGYVTNRKSVTTQVGEKASANIPLTKK